MWPIILHGRGARISQWPWHFASEQKAPGKHVLFGSTEQLAPGHAQDRGQHFLFGADILQRMETRARFYGERIGVRFGEPLLARGPLPCFDPLLG